MSANRSFQFFPLDHVGDIQLRGCSLEAKGLWMDMLCLMAQGEPFGCLRYDPNKQPEFIPAVAVNGDRTRRPSTVTVNGHRHGDRHGDRHGSLEPDLPTLLGQPAAAVKRALKNLEGRQVFSRTPEGIIYSRRMVRDAARRKGKPTKGGMQARDATGRFGKRLIGPEMSPAPAPSTATVHGDRRTAPSTATVHGDRARSAPSLPFPSTTKNPTPHPRPTGRGIDAQAVARSLAEHRTTRKKGDAPNA